MAGIARAVHRLQVSWTAFATGYFRIGTSTLGGTDTLGVSQADPRFSGVYDDVTSLLRTATWSRGRSEDYTAMEGGTASYDLRDADGAYNPENPSSVLYGLIGERLHPVRHHVSLDGGLTWTGLFGGWVKSVAPTVGRRKSTVTLNCVDLYYWLDRTSPVLPNVGPEWTGDAIGRVLDSIGLFDPAMRVLDKGDWLLNGFSSDGSNTGTALIQALLEAERGVFFADGFGRARYRDRHRPILTTSSGTINGILRAIAPGSDSERVLNIVPVTVLDASGTTIATVQSTDEESRRRFGDAQLGEISTPYITPGDAGPLGAYIVSQTSSPRGALRSLQIDSREAALLAHIVQRELGDVVEAVEAVAGTTGDYAIDRLTGTVDMQTGDMQATYMLSRRVALDTTVLLLGTGLIGSGSMPY